MNIVNLLKYQTVAKEKGKGTLGIFCSYGAVLSGPVHYNMDLFNLVSKPCLLNTFIKLYLHELFSNLFTSDFD